VEKFLFMSCSLQKSINSFDVKSPPLSDLRHLIFESISFSTISLYVLKFLNAYDILFRNKIVVILL
jgi:hypothetical protein